MPSLRLAVSPELVGFVVPEMPYARRVEFAQAVTVDYQLADAGSTFSAIPGQTVFTTVQAIILTSNKDVTIRYSGQTDGGGLLKAGGIFILYDCEITDVEIANDSGDTAQIRGALAGA